jgi:hypothetical protein
MSASCPCGYRFECPCGCQTCPRCGPDPGPAPRVAGAIGRGLADARTARLFGAEQSPNP